MFAVFHNLGMTLAFLDRFLVLRGILKWLGGEWGDIGLTEF